MDVAGQVEWEPGRNAMAPSVTSGRITEDTELNTKRSTAEDARQWMREAEEARRTMDRGEVGKLGTVGTLASHKSEGKPLVNDLDPRFILDMGDVMTQGLTKYPNDPDGVPNWWKGGDYRSFCASILRHALKLAAGEDTDEESGLPHAAHIAVDAMFLRSWQRRGVGKDTRLTGVQKESQHE